MNLKVSDLQPGDVLLSFGHGWLSDAIRFLDGGRYSHAGFFDGVRVVEATKAGIGYNNVIADLDVQQYIHVYRYRSDGGAQLGSPGFPVQPLVDVATRYRHSGGKFAYQQLFLLALLATSRRGPLPLFLKKLLRKVLDDAVSALNDVLQNKQQPVICSELVYRIYYEAPPSNQYGLGIKGVIEIEKFQNLVEAPVLSLGKSVDEDGDAAAFDRVCEEFAQRYAEAKTPEGAKTLAAKGPNPWVQADFVTPNDLETSANLEEIGPLVP